VKEIIQNINEITDSREILATKSSKVIPIFIYTLIGLLLTAIVWSYFGEIDDTVKAMGIVRPNEKISLITNKIMGNIQELNISEGDKVKADDILYIINHGSYLEEQNLLGNEIEETKFEIKNLLKYKESIIKDENLFDENLENEKEYYLKYESLNYGFLVEKDRINSMDIDYDKTVSDLKLTNSDIEQRIAKARSDLEGNKTLRNSIADNKDRTKNSGFRIKYDNYLLNIKVLTNAYDKNKSSYEKSKKLYEIGSITKSELDNAKEAMDNSEIDLQKYKNEYILGLNDIIDGLESEIFSLNTTYNKNTNAINQYSKKNIDTELLTNKYINDLLVSIDDSLLREKDRLESLEKDYNKINITIDECYVRAPIDGVLNIKKEISKRDLVMSGEEIASIVPYNNDIFKIQVYVSNKDISKIKEGGEIKYHFFALPYKEYGELTGTIVKIGNDIITDKSQNSQESFYFVEADIENRTLYSYKGVPAEIKTGMQCEAYATIRTKKLLYYFLEKIKLRD
jgi:multidrug resistance efflux pump